MKKMRKYLTIILVVIMMISMAAVPAYADSTVEEWHTKEFKTMYARIIKTEAWQKLDPEVQKQLKNYAISDKDNAESLLILRTIDFVKYVDNRREDSESIIGKYIDLLSSKEFQVYLLLSELAKYDGLRVDKNKNGHYAVFKTDIPTVSE